MGNWTPGPWTAHHGWAGSGPQEGHPEWCEVVSEADQKYNRMSVSGHCGIANARRIAAAPDLLEANISFVKAAEYEFGIRSTWCDDQIYNAFPAGDLAMAYFDARAAIARATGETHER